MVDQDQDLKNKKKKKKKKKFKNLNSKRKNIYKQIQEENRERNGEKVKYFFKTWYSLSYFGVLVVFSIKVD